MSFSHKFKFSNPYVFAIWCHRPQIFQIMNSVRPNKLSFKCLTFTPSGYKGLENLSLWQRLNSFTFVIFQIRIKINLVVSKVSFCVYTPVSWIPTQNVSLVSLTVVSQACWYGIQYTSIKLELDSIGNHTHTIKFVIHEENYCLNV